MCDLLHTSLKAVSHDPALVLVSGVLSFVAGLAVVRVHNHWAADWAVLVTIFGWLLLIGGPSRALPKFESYAVFEIARIFGPKSKAGN
jgi:uncharacterized membrane protein HdeD (DUF308 family)